jgi:hypothetical protein
VEGPHDIIGQRRSRQCVFVAKSTKSVKRVLLIVNPKNEKLESAEESSVGFRTLLDGHVQPRIP